MSSRRSSDRDSTRDRDRDRDRDGHRHSKSRSSRPRTTQDASPTSEGAMDARIGAKEDTPKKLEDASPLDVRAARKVWECDVSDVLKRLEAVEAICIKKRCEEDRDSHFAESIRQKDYESVCVAIENSAILLTGAHRSLMNVWKIAKHLPDRRAKAKKLYQKWTEGCEQIKDAITRLGHKNGVPDWGRLDEATRVKIFDMWETCRDAQMEARIPWQEALGMEELMLAVLCHSRAQPGPAAAMMEAKFAASQEGFTTSKITPQRTGAMITAQRTGMPPVMAPQITGQYTGMPQQQTGMISQYTGMPQQSNTLTGQYTGMMPNRTGPNFQGSGQPMMMPQQTGAGQFNSMQGMQSQMTGMSLANSYPSSNFYESGGSVPPVPSLPNQYQTLGRNDLNNSFGGNTQSLQAGNMPSVGHEELSTMMQRNRNAYNAMTGTPNLPPSPPTSSTSSEGTDGGGRYLPQAPSAFISRMNPKQTEEQRFQVKYPAL